MNERGIDTFELVLRTIMFCLAVGMLVFTVRASSLREQVLGAASTVVSLLSFTAVGKRK